ncbi:AAA family ATPase [Corynebacterium nasicanis]|uniref:AAA family ATPase n=1 Tax=Corynebacterium nasicanis TaxID=1448267 RepID=A0ABW1Q966_9CORY
MSESNDKIPWLRGNKRFRDSAIRNNRKGTHYILTEETPSGKKISVAQDGQTEYGQSRRGRATAIYPQSDGAQRSALSEYGSADFPTVCAAKKEIETWNLLALEPSAMRSSSNMTDPDHVSTQGGNLPKALFRLTEMGKQKNVLERVAHSVSGLVNFRELVLDYDQQRQQITLFGRTGEDPLLPARSLSDGTLRFLALCVLQIDPSVEGLICLEEPENGIHPSNLGEMYSLLKSLAVDPELPVSEDNPLRQVIVNTHSPTYVMIHRDAPEELLFADKRQVLAEFGAGGDRKRTAALVLRPVGANEGNWRRFEDSGSALPISAVVDYLSQGIEGVQSLISYDGDEV